MVYVYSIEGNIGSGKSTLVEILKQKFPRIIFLLEPVDVWNTIKDEKGETILSKFYADQDKYSFPFQMMAYISRISQLRKAIKENPDSIIITERSVHTDKNIFAKMLYDDKKIEQVNYNIYLKWFDEFAEGIPSNGIIYVRTSPEKAFERVIKRNRKGENIPLEYLKNCHKYHEEWLSDKDNKLVLDGNTDFDFNVSEYNDWIETIKKYITRKWIFYKKESSIDC